MRTRVLIVDDSPTMRSLVAGALRRDPDIEVVGTACDPLEARTAIKDLNPDVITLDIEMPKMDGLSFLEKVMRLRPMPVIMISSLTQRGAEASIKAMELGAVDCVGKPGMGHSALEAFADLPMRVKAARHAQVANRGAGVPSRSAPAAADYQHDGRVVCIGASTGGVEALLSVVSTFPKNCPPTLIVQHMPENFTRSFAARLDKSCAAEVAEAYDGAPIEAGRVWLAPGGLTHLKVSGTQRPRCQVVPGDLVSGHRPSVDALFRSAAPLGEKAVGVILTGMGRDGAAGLLAMRNAGSVTIGQDESSSLIYGMPKAAFELGAVQEQLPIQAVGPGILGRCQTHRRGA